VRIRQYAEKRNGPDSCVNSHPTRLSDLALPVILPDYARQGFSFPSDPQGGGSIAPAVADFNNMSGSFRFVGW